MSRLFIAIVVTTSVFAVNANAKDRDEKETQYGPVVCHSVTFVKPPNNNARTWDGAVTRAINIALPGDTTVCYDADRMTVASYWRGGFLDFSKTHHTSYKGNICPRPGAEPKLLTLTNDGWVTKDGPLMDGQRRFDGYYLHGNQVVVQYTVAGRRVLEMPGEDERSLLRDIHVGAGEEDLSVLIAPAPGEAAVTRQFAMIGLGKSTLGVYLSGAVQELDMRLHNKGLYVNIPASKSDVRFRVRFGIGDADAAEAFIANEQREREANLPDMTKLTQGGPRRWKETFTTEGKLGEQEGAYALDELPTPIRPYGSWMRLSAIDFFDDGRAAVATLPGDIWIVSWDDDDISKITWQRFATGLYEPLGMKVVDGKIYVRGRDRITRLHDLNDDGEADYYENFHSHGPVGPGYHAFVFDLNTDQDGNFWFVKSGRKGPSIGEVIKVAPDGKKFDVIATHFRHPNGMGFGGPHNWVTISENADGKYPSGAMIVKEGQSYGWEGPQTHPYLYVVPPKVDTSPGSQCWADTKRFGPLSGSIIHTSYSTSSISYVLTQNSSPHPSGYAVHMPFGFKSGPMRLRVSPRDGQMYIACQRGWDSNAAADGMIHRLRYTGQDAYVVTGAKATKAGVELTFSCELDAATADFDNFFAARVDGKNEDEVDIDDVELINKNTVLVKFFEEDIDPSQIVDREATKRAAKKGDDRTHYRVVAPLAITFNMKAHDGTPLKETVYCTINGY